VSDVICEDPEKPEDKKPTSKYLVGQSLNLDLLGKNPIIEEELSQESLDRSVLNSQDNDLGRLERIMEITSKLEKAEKYSGLNKWFQPNTSTSIDKMPKHKMFFTATKTFSEVYFSAANRSGKTISAAYCMTCWATGIYPDWWPGRKFRGPTRLFAAGITNKLTRDVIQKELLGDIGSLGTGMIPAELIVGTSSKSGVANAVDVIQVRNIDGGISTIGLLSFEQGRESFQGWDAHAVWMDEMPDEDVYSEAYMRTLTTGGLIITTATPLGGMTPLVLNLYTNSTFLPEDQELPSVIRVAREDKEREEEEKRRKGEEVSDVIKSSKAVVLAAWDDAPWITEDMKIKFLAARPPHLRQASSTGIPGTAGGNIYPVPLDEILIDDFAIPKHYKFVNGFDVGWNNSACMFGAVDPDTDTIYIYAEYLRGQVEPTIHAQAIKTKSIWLSVPSLSTQHPKDAGRLTVSSS
jgi:phage terminase large subunit-like protein